MTGPIEIKPVHTKADLDLYIRLPLLLYKDSETYTPPLLHDEKAFHDPSKNKNLAQSDQVRFLAFSNGKPVGRMMGIRFRKFIIR